MRCGPSRSPQGDKTPESFLQDFEARSDVRYEGHRADGTGIGRNAHGG